jgi:hypothetical protein
VTRLRALLLLLAASGAALVAGDPQAQQAAPAPSGPAPQAPAPAPVAPAPAPTAPPARDIEDFVPSEKVSADDAVAFPTDI